MADNIAVTPGAGATVAADEVGGVKFQRIKLALGADGVNDGDLSSSNPMPVDATGAGDLPVTLDGEAVTLAANSGVDIGDVDVASIAAGETHIGQVGASDAVVTVTASLDTSAYAEGDVLFDTQEIASAVRTSGGIAILQSIVVIDKDDQAIELDLVFLDASTSIGTENSAPDVSDTDADDIVGIVNVADYVDLGGVSIATVSAIGLEMKADASAALYVAGITRGAPTHTASGIIVKFAFLRS